MLHTLKRWTACISAVVFFINPLAAYAAVLPSPEASLRATLLNPVEYGESSEAQEVPSLRTMTSATFELSNGSRVVTTVRPGTFTHHPLKKDLIVLASSTGVATQNSFDFLYLPDDTRISFSLTEPSYTYTKGNHSFTYAVQTEMSLPATILNDHQIQYQLSPSARLVWTVTMSGVKKDIFVDQSKNSHAEKFSFRIISDLAQSLQDNIISLEEKHEKVFSLESPYILTIEGSPTLSPITITQSQGNLYTYEYDDALLPNEYIIDPFMTPYRWADSINSESSPSSNACTWSNTSYAVTSDDQYTQCESTENSGVSPYLIGTNMFLSVPSGSTIQGMIMTVEGHASSGLTFNIDPLIYPGTGGSPEGSPGSSSGNSFSDSGDTTATFGSPTDTWGYNGFTSGDPSSIITSPYFGYAIRTSNLEVGDIAYIDTVRMKMYYISPCEHPYECVSNGNDPINWNITDACTSSNVCGECSSNSECASGVCSSGTCVGAEYGESCTQNGDCLSGSCLKDPYASTGRCQQNNYACIPSLPSNLAYKTQDGDLAYDYTDFTKGIPTPVRLVDTDHANAIIAGFTLIRPDDDLLNSNCDLTDITGAETNLTTKLTYFHPSISGVANNVLQFGVQNGYDLYIPKSSSHNRLRVCEEDHASCTSSDSWLFVVNEAGTFILTNVDTTGISVEVKNGYWIVHGLPGAYINTSYGIVGQGFSDSSSGAVCTVESDCSSQKACVSNQCVACSTNGQCASGVCSGGQCQGVAPGGSCTTNSQCRAGHCFSGKCMTGNKCSYETNALPDGILMYRKSNNTQITYGDLPEGIPTDVYFKKSGVKFSEVTLTQISGKTGCFTTLHADVNPSTSATLFHPTDSELGTNGNVYTMYVPKLAEHDQVRICSGKSTLGCSSLDSWSFLANTSGEIIATNGGFDASGITVSVSGGSWVISGLTGTGGQGEMSGGTSGGSTGGSTGGPVDVPEFSTYALLLLIGGAYLLIRQEASIG